MRIVICYPAEPRHMDQIAATCRGCDVVQVSEDTVGEEIVAADIFCGHPKAPLDWDRAVRQGRLRWIQSSAAGVDFCLVPSVIASDIRVTSVSGQLANQVAEHTVALLAGLVRSMPTFYRAQQAREFVRRPTGDLHYSTIGIVGLGGVGRRVAEILSAFRTRIVATDWFPVDRPTHVEAVWPADQLDRLLAIANVLVLSAPLTPQTRGLIDAAALARLPRGSLLVNVARGALVVEPDLVAALRSGHLAGAALDVTNEEPLPATSPLWELPQVIITPHVAGQSQRRLDETTDFISENLRRYLAGEPLRNLVDKRLGFPLPETRAGPPDGP